MHGFLSNVRARIGAFSIFSPVHQRIYPGKEGRSLRSTPVLLLAIIRRGRSVMNESEGLALNIAEGTTNFSTNNPQGST